MDIIDTHQHLIWRDRLRYGWTGSIPVLATGDFLPDTYCAEVAGCGVTGSIFMETGVDDSFYRDEARHVATLIGKHGIMGLVASCRPEDASGFDAWIDECADLAVRGFRRILHVMPDDLSRSDTFRTNLRKIGQKGLTFDLCLLARQLPIAAELAQACPDQVFVLDHCGVPDIAANAFDPWAASIRDLAAFSNLNIKLSGISAYCGPKDPSVDLLQPWVTHVLDCFGPSRMVWGSDWPVVRLGSNLRRWIDQSRTLLSGLSLDEQAMIFHGNARRIYKL